MEVAPPPLLFLKTRLMLYSHLPTPAFREGITAAVAVVTDW